MSDTMNEDGAADPVTGARPLGPDAARELLERVVHRAGQEAPDSIVVFDLDSTLLDNSPRQARIMREYGAEVGVEALARVDASHWDGWDVTVAMRAVGLDEDAVAAHAAPFKDFWRERFFTSEYCLDDHVVPGAVDYVAAVAQSRARIYYVTGRHEEMRDGSIGTFRRVGLPIPDGREVVLLMKPTLSEEDDDYKHRTYAELRGQGAVVAAFDNEPEHINGYFRAFPEALVVHLATDHSLRDIKLEVGIPSIRDFTAYARE